jgi:hypothetical protein
MSLTLDAYRQIRTKGEIRVRRITPGHLELVVPWSTDVVILKDTLAAQWRDQLTVALGQTRPANDSDIPPSRL